MCQIEFVVREYARDIVERRKANIGAAEQQGVVLGVRIRAGDQPIETDGADEGGDVSLAIRRIGAQEFDDVASDSARLRFDISWSA